MKIIVIIFFCIPLYIKASYLKYYRELQALSSAIQEGSLRDVKKYPHIKNTWLPRIVRHYPPVPGDNPVGLATRLYVQSRGEQKKQYKSIIKHLLSIGSDPFFENHERISAAAIAKYHKKFDLSMRFERKKPQKKRK
jgi:hypothetical protein